MYATMNESKLYQMERCTSRTEDVSVKAEDVATMAKYTLANIQIITKLAGLYLGVATLDLDL